MTNISKKLLSIGIINFVQKSTLNYIVPKFKDWLQKRKSYFNKVYWNPGFYNDDCVQTQDLVGFFGTNKLRSIVFKSD